MVVHLSMARTLILTDTEKQEQDGYVNQNGNTGATDVRVIIIALTIREFKCYEKLSQTARRHVAKSQDCTIIVLETAKLAQTLDQRVTEEMKTNARYQNLCIYKNP